MQNSVTYTVVVEAPNPNFKLLPGMTANMSFEIEKRSDVPIIPNSALQFSPKPEQVRECDRTILESELTDSSSDAGNSTEIRSDAGVQKVFESHCRKHPTAEIRLDSPGRSAFGRAGRDRFERQELHRSHVQQAERRPAGRRGHARHAPEIRAVAYALVQAPTDSRSAIALEMRRWGGLRSLRTQDGEKVLPLNSPLVAYLLLLLPILPFLALSHEGYPLIIVSAIIRVRCLRDAF